MSDNENPKDDGQGLLAKIKNALFEQEAPAGTSAPAAVAPLTGENAGPPPQPLPPPQGHVTNHATLL
ncbi:hypothetical protein [Rhodoferax sp.]|uniref:hypothetical protein n=1 Tax=Rhodoferax sp. TaxID=50421 RepID=UPI002ACD82BD|nr:hypothetical protein [Rhodoferax sp.]MDZ7921355.1 hypothetical protein [Rhodoferax sp.]